MNYTELIKKAALISFEAHKYDIDKGGYPYFMHPFTLASKFDDEDLCCTAFLHDVVEDHGDKYTFKYLEEEGFNNNIINALKLLTHEFSSYEDYVKNLSTNEIARKVKLEDLRNNTDLRRTNGKKPRKYDLYLWAINYLENID